MIARQLFDRRARPQYRGIVQQAVEAAEGAFDGCGQFVILVRQGGFQVEGNHHGLGMPSRFDLVIHLVEIFFVLAQQ